jgi:LysR family transcriptional regulator for metE and metH
MEVRHFKLISTISRLGSMSKAAEELCLTQSALSHQLKEAESRYGIQIFSRVNNKLILSDAGEIILEFANDILDRIEQMNETLRMVKNSELGTIRLSLEAYTSYYWLPSMLRRYNEQFPNIDVQITTENPTRPVEDLRNGKVDFAIMVYEPQDPTFQTIPLFEDELVVVVSSTHPLASNETINIRDLDNEKILTHTPKHEHHMVLEKSHSPKELNPERFIHIASTETIINMTAENIGVAILSRWAIQPYLDSRIKLLPIGSEEGLRKNWYLVSFKRELALHEEHFVRLLREYIANPSETNKFTQSGS